MSFTSSSGILLPAGLCYFKLDGPPTGRLVMCLHGATVAHWEFDRLVPLLHDAGLRTLRFDFYGHGDSARPRTRYTQALFVQQALALLNALQIEAPVTLLGHSLGAAVAARLLLAAPGRFDRAVLGAPLVNYLENVPAGRLLRWPVVGEALVYGYVLPMLRRRRARRYGPIEDGRFVGKFMRQLAQPGFGRAVLSLFRSGTLGDQLASYRALEPLPHPLLVLRGEEDTVCSASQIERLREMLPRAGYERLGATGHAMMLSDPEPVAATLLPFLLRDVRGH